MKNRILRALLLSTFGVALGASSALANSATYSPTSKPVAGTLPLTTQTYTLAITSPSSLNALGMAKLDNGVVASIKVSVALFPDDGSAAEALGLVSVSPTSVLFTGLSQTQNVTVSVTAPAGTTVGLYAYDIQADPVDSVPSWGVGKSVLSLDLSGPVALDTTPPALTITSPASASTFDFCSAGNTINIGIDASDAESFVTAVNADVNGTAVTFSSFTPSNNVSVTGTYAATDLGSYTISATATSTGGTSAPVTSTFSVNYTMGFLPPLSLGKTSKGGSTIPIKFSARDCTGAFVADERVSVKVYEGTTLLFTAVYGEGSDSVRIDVEAGQYIANFQTAAGAHVYTAKVFFNNVQQASINFATR